MKQYAKYRRKLERDKSHNNYKSRSAFQETPRPHTTKIPYNRETATTADNSFTAAMEYAAALEEKAHAQAKRIIDLEASVDDQTVLTESTNYAASAVTTGGSNKDLKNLRSTMKQLTASFTSQATTLAALSVRTNSGGGGQNTENKKAQSGLHVCAHCKQEIYHKDGNCLELSANSSKR